MSISVLKTKNIIENFSGVTFDRGLKYFKKGYVLPFDVTKKDRQETIIHAQVLGSASLPYKQSIEIIYIDADDVDIEGFCSCPVHYNCKHVVAVCLAYQADFNKSSVLDDNQVSTQCLAWLDQFSNLGRANSRLDVQLDFIAYILSESKNPGVLKLQFYITRELKKGGLGKGRSIGLDNIIDPYRSPACVRDDDRDIGKLLITQKFQQWGVYSVEISGELGGLALKKMLNTGRCYWLDTGGSPIRFGDLRPLQIQWQKHNQNEYELQLDITPTAMPLNTCPAMYIDIETGTIGSLSGADFTEQQWSMLISAPKVPAKLAQDFSAQLATQTYETSLPTPVKVETLDFNAEDGRPSLRLFSDLAGDGQRIHVLHLFFSYGEYQCELLPIEPQWSFRDNNRIVRIQRDNQLEQVALELLLAQGFQVMPDEFATRLNLVSPGGLSESESVMRWQYFLELVLPQLEEDGWRIHIETSFKLEFLQADEWYAEIDTDSDNDWFDLRFDLEVKGKKLALLPIIADILSIYDLDELPDVISLPLGDSQYLQLPAERIRPICQTLYELYNHENLDRSGALRLNHFDAARLSNLEQDLDRDGGSIKTQWLGGKALRKLGRDLNNFDGIKSVAIPKGLKTELRPYQQQGFNWLQFLRSYGLNGILADDMGLGKTVQTLAHLLREKESRRLDKPCLIIAPTSLMGNWRREALQFTPRLKVLILQGPNRHADFERILEHDLILSTYPLLVRDEKELLAHHYHSLILDEAQIVKNPNSKAAKIVRKIHCKHRLCLTGTPMENHLGELWTQFDFLMPGFLGTAALFKKLFRNPIENHGNQDQRKMLVRRIAPFMLRRSKSEVIKELPDKTEILRSVVLESKQAALYESIRLAMQKKVRDAIAKKGLARSHITILDALLKLRQTCCDPRLLSIPQAKQVKQSAKLLMLMEMLPELIEEGRRILLFSQFTKMLAIIEQELQQADISYLKLTGKTRNRDKVLDAFRSGSANVFLISLKAGGVGLNLTEADTVIHYDPWWNPATQNQATDRVHRIGQKKAVFVYQLITENTVEEKIIAMQEQKQALADGVYNGDGSTGNFSLSADDLQVLFSPLSS